MTEFKRLEAPPSNIDIAVRGPIAAYPYYEAAIREAGSACTRIAQMGDEQTTNAAHLAYGDLSLPDGEAGLELTVGDWVRSLGALGLVRFLDGLVAKAGGIDKQLSVETGFGFTLHTHDSPPKTQDWSMEGGREFDDLMYGATGPLNGMPLEAVHTDSSGVERISANLLPFHPTLQFHSKADWRRRPERHDGWYRNAAGLLVHRVTEVPVAGPRHDTERVLIVPYADTTKTYSCR